VIALVLSILLPGLGHAYMLRLPRALVWFGGVIALGAVLRSGPEDRALSFWMLSALGVLAALDLLLAMWLESRSGGHR
jgi:hypothetical protein